MKKHFTLLSPLMVFITLIFILACSQPVPISKTEIKQTSIKIEEDDFETYYPASDVVDSINYIYLETNELSLFGQITKMEIFEDLFFIYDRSANFQLQF